MTAKEYLSQAYQIEARIKIKMEHAQYYYDIATKANAIFSDIPLGIHRTDGTIAHLADLKKEINSDISRLVELKSEIKTQLIRWKILHIELCSSCVIFIISDGMKLLQSCIMRASIYLGSTTWLLKK